MNKILIVIGLIVLVETFILAINVELDTLTTIGLIWCGVGTIWLGSIIDIISDGGLE